MDNGARRAIDFTAVTYSLDSALDPKHHTGKCTMRAKRGPKSGYFVKDRYYHIINRSCRQLKLYSGSVEYLKFEALLLLFAQRYHVDLIGYAIMPTHFHLIIRVRDESAVNMFMQVLSCCYSKFRNQRQGTVGTNFDGRYLSKLVRTASQLANLLRYVHTNPVKDGLVSHPSFWPYSDYLRYVEDQVTDMQRITIEGLFKAIKYYTEFIENTLWRLRHIHRPVSNIKKPRRSHLDEQYDYNVSVNHISNVTRLFSSQ